MGSEIRETGRRDSGDRNAGRLEIKPNTAGTTVLGAMDGEIAV